MKQHTARLTKKTAYQLWKGRARCDSATTPAQHLQVALDVLLLLLVLVVVLVPVLPLHVLHLSRQAPERLGGEHATR